MKTLRLIPAIALLLVVFAGCEEKAPISQTPGPGAPASTASPSSDPATYGDREVSLPSAWPPPKSGEKVEIAKDLLAKNYVVVLDGSGSMDERACGASEKKMAIARKALAEFAKTVPDDANLGLVGFDSAGTTERLALGTKNRDRFAAAVARTGAGGGTPLHNAVVLGYQLLETQARRQLGYGEYHLVVVTDGEANEGQDPRNAVDRILRNSPVSIYTIGFCISESHSLNQKGRISYRPADDHRSLSEGLKDVLAESPTFDVKSFK